MRSQKIFRLNAKVENDAAVAAIAEAKFGAGKRYSNFLFVIWGTGVGGGIILNGSIYRGPFGGAGEIGHVCIDYNGLQCNCGAMGCVEAYVGSALSFTEDGRSAEEPPPVFNIESLSAEMFRR
jgi:predicted NBD/HSP70 family sugar kinase